MRRNSQASREPVAAPSGEYADLLYNPRTRGPLPVGTLQRCASLVDSVGIPELLVEWDHEVHAPSQGGRPSALSMRAVAVLWLVLAWEHQPLQLKRLRDIISERLTPETAAILGITLDKGVSPDAWYERVRRATRRILGLIDYHPVFNRHRRLQKAEWDRVLAEREAAAEVLSARARRAEELMNRLLHATYLLIPARLRSGGVSVAIDATAVRVHARGLGRQRIMALQAHQRVPIEPDAGFWQRDTEDHAPDGSAPIARMKFGFELELGVLTSDDPSRSDDIPHIVLGVGYHAPAFGPGRAARNMFENILARGLQLDHVIGDRAYLPGAKSEELQNFLRSAGAMLVMDYHKHFLGHQASYAGAIMVDGNWYCPSMPQHLIDATKRRRAGDEADDKDRALTDTLRKAAAQRRFEQWCRDIEAREAYMLTEKQGAKPDGTLTFKCPAYGRSATAACAKKKNQLPPGAVPLVIIPNPPRNGGKICENTTSAAFPPNVGGKFAQHYQYGSKKWRAMYAHGRNSVESFNAYLKDGGTHALEDGSRRRLRGSVAQYFLATLTVVAANLDKIHDFAAQKTEDGLDYEAGLEAPRAKQRKPRRSSALQRVTHQRGRAKRNPVRT